MKNFVIIEIGKNKIAFNIEQIHFIVRNNGIVSLPSSPSWLEGIISYRDKIVPVLNNKIKLKMENDNSEKKRILLCTLKDGTLIGINFDRYIGIERIDKTEEYNTKQTIKTDNEVIPVINADNLLKEEEIEFIKKI